MIAEKRPRLGSRPPANVPTYLICEIMDDKPLYYKGYRDALSGKKTVGEIVGSTTVSKKVTVATPGQPWQVIDWDQDIDLLAGVTMNVGRYLTDRGVLVR